MLELLTIYGTTFSAAGLLAVALLPKLRAQVTRYLKTGTEQAGAKLAELFIEIPKKHLKLFYALSPVGVGLAGWMVFQSPVALGAGAVAGLWVPRFTLRFLRARRQKQFAKQLVDALMGLSSSLRAGLSLMQALETLAEESPPPMSQEIGLVVKEVKMGVAFEESLNRFKVRMPVDELHLVITAILVARETGGDVTHLFGKLVETIRERMKMKERIKTLTVIPRMQGWMMALIPAGFAYFAMKISPGYFDMMLSDRMGNLVGLTAGGFWLLGLLLVLRFSRPPRWG